MNILAVCTSTARGSVALVRPRGEVTASYVDLQGHAERLFQAIDEVLARAGETRRAVEAVACDVGPGSFTGVRVGVASAKGLALGLEVPLAGAGSLEAMAAAAFGSGDARSGDVVLAAIDAKKSELYVAAYDAAGREIVPPETMSLAASAVEAAVLRASKAKGEGGRVVVVGEILATITLPVTATLCRGAALDLPDATWIARVAAPRLEEETGDVEPVYVRPPDITQPTRRAPAGSG